MERVTCNFNLRNRRSNKPSIIYMVVYADGRQYKISTGIKILSSQWDFKKQLPVVDKTFSESSNRHGIETLTFLNALRFCFEEYCIYICAGNLTFEITELQTYLMSDIVKLKTHKMSVKRITPKNTTAATKVTNGGEKGTDIMAKAFEAYKRNQPLTNPKTIKIYNGFINEWCTWCKKNRKPNDIGLFSQDNFNEYKEYLSSTKIARKTINTKMRILKGIINGYVVEKYKVAPLFYQKLSVKNDSKKPKYEILDDEIKRFGEVPLTSPNETYKKMFLLQLATGQRIEDTYNLVQDYINGEAKWKFIEKIDDGDKETIIVLYTPKNKSKSIIHMTSEVKNILEWFKANKKIKDRPLKNFTPKYNGAIKEIAMKAGLDRAIYYDDKKTGRQKNKPLYKAISSHGARHTFVTKMCRVYEVKDVAPMIGDTVKTVIDNYLHPTTDDKINNARKAIENIKDSMEKAEATPTPTQAVSNKADEELFRLKQKDEWKMILTYLGYDAVDYCEIKDDDDFWRMIRDKELELEEIGVNKGKLKNLYNGKEFNMKEKRDLLEDIALQLRKVHADDTLMPEQKESMKKDILSVIKDGA